MAECVFCSIARMEQPALLIFESEEFMAFPPLVKASEGHTLLIPRVHYADIYDIDPETFERLAGVALSLSRQLTRTNGATGINLLHASGADAQQSVFHFHLHLVPRYQNDGLDLWLRSNL